MNIQEFQDKLKEIQTLAMKNGKQVQAELVQQFFGEEGMDQEKLKKVFDFLEMQGITVHGYSKKCEVTQKVEEVLQVPLTAEEEEYLEEYLETLGEIEGFDREQLLADFIAGEDVKESILKSYQKEVVQIAKELHSGEIFFGDLLQEGNMGLLMALEQAAAQEEIHTWLMSEIRSSIRLFMEEQSQQKKEDDILVEKVRNLEAKVKELTEDEDVKYSVEELAAFLDMDVEEMESVLRLTGDDK
ncbi:MAG: RNA polymerase subunit sigma-70 [Blautia sp.]|uniref:RNA polymerase subunit sigma-70 n=1 Tax=Blautia sp. TaxID=1955243 RepID=UPI002E799781|nr:RNA polymerase subunit sigma-70 [Blautia sp.]MEE1444398.1 RNA polymerase subunit sigma-70 [Blautia sp.]